MIHIRINNEQLNSKRKFACGLGPHLPEGDQFFFEAETANPLIMHKVDCPGCNPNRGERPRVGTPLLELSGRPGHRGYERFVEIARSWGCD